MENRIESGLVADSVITFLSRKETRKPSIRLVQTILSKFFLPQFQSRIGIKKRKVVNVDHELDKKIPFSPDYLSTYMNFSPLWIKTIYFLYKEFKTEALPFIAEFIKDMDKLYRKGFEVYNSCQSTTSRPGAGKNIPLKLMQLADPHLHCVPSLHVMVVCFNHLRFSAIIEKLAEDPEEYKAEREYTGDQALLIISSILFMKQHSVNCIPAGLFALAPHCPEFNDDYAMSLIEGIGRLNTDQIEGIDEVTAYISHLYNHFREVSVSYPSESDVLINFLENYKQIR